MEIKSLKRFTSLSSLSNKLIKNFTNDPHIAVFESNICKDINFVIPMIACEKAKEYILNYCSKYQIAKPGHRTQEHLFALKSKMALYDLLGLPIIIQF